MADQKIYIFALAAHGKGISGSDRIFIEFAKRWAKLFPVRIYVGEEGAQMLQRQHLGTSNFQPPNSKLQIKILKMGIWCRLGFGVCYFARIIHSITEAFKLTINHQSSTIIYSASEFWMDSLPAFILKMRYPKIKWAAAWYQTAPKPWVGFTEGERVNTYKLNSFLYWLVQLPIKPLVSRFADFVLVNNDMEKKQFPRLYTLGRTIVVLGAVDLKAIKNFKKNYPKKYDAVFQGRFHPQKGILELIDIWKIVIAKIPKALLAMIGDGPLMRSVKLKIKKEKLEKNVKLFGFLFDGPKKYRIFSQSKIVVHPAFYDSGGMASAEAIAFGLPAVGFDLRAYQSYYPKGMIRVNTGDLKGFAEIILTLLENSRQREKLGKEARLMIEKNWSWDKRAAEVLSKITKKR